MWPTPGARIWALDPNNLLWNPDYSAQPHERYKWWPFLGAQSATSTDSHPLRGCQAR